VVRALTLGLGHGIGDVSKPHTSCQPVMMLIGMNQSIVRQMDEGSDFNGECLQFVDLLWLDLRKHSHKGV